MGSKKGKKLGAGRVAFLARLNVFQEKIKAGYMLAALYEEYQNQLGISYSQFVRYVNRYARGKPSTEKSDEVLVTKEKELSTREFLHTRPNKKELLDG